MPPRHTLMRFAAGMLLLLSTAAAVQAEVRYARHFDLRQGREYIVAEVRPVWRGADAPPLRYVFIQPDSSSPEEIRERIHDRFPDLGERAVFRPPVESLVLLSSTYLSALTALGGGDALAGVDAKEHIYDPRVRRMIEAGRVAELGSTDVDLEQLVALQPGAVMAPGGRGEWNVVPGLEKAGVPYLVNADYLESSPLGRAEWIKLTALLLDRLPEARKIFRRVEQRYLQLAERAASAEGRPQVLLNRPMQERWTVPGGESYMARLIADAGGAYLWADRGGTGSMVLDQEAVYAEAAKADVWIHQYGWDSLAEIAEAEPLLTRIPAYRRGRVVNNDRRVNEEGANDFYESGTLRPDLILADLISLFHPALLPDHELHYYRYLE